MNEQPLWQPDPQRAARTNLTRFWREAERRAGRAFADYAALHRWSIEQSADFWQLVWDFGHVSGNPGLRRLINSERMPGARWFPEGTLNFAQNLLRERDALLAISFWGEDQVKRRMSRRELYDLVSRIAQALRAAGVTKGDRVAGYLPNLPESVAAMLAATSIGAIWSSCSPDFGVQGVLDRFGQIEPKVLFCADRYFYGGKAFDLLDKVREILPQLPSVRACVVIPYVGEINRDGPHLLPLQDFVAPYQPASIAFEQVEFNHPLYILYSSGTTGVPKCIVHGTGGTLLQHLKEHQLHADVQPGDRVFFFTTLGWMMWNWLVSGLASGAGLLLYDGSPFVGRGRVLFDFAEAEGMTHFGTSAKFIDAIAKINLKPRETHDLSRLRAILSTGSPLVPEGFDYVYANVRSDVCLSSISGGTDIVSCFVNGNPVSQVRRGEIMGKGLGMAVEVWNDAGQPVIGEKGELVCTRHFPAMPVGLWNDADGEKLRKSYFSLFPGVWAQGDYAEQLPHGGIMIHGRSDAVLNPGGVRIGTAEIYRQVEKIPQVLDSVAIGQQWQDDVRVVLFVKLREGLELDEALQQQIRKTIRANTTPRHVPAKIVAVTDIPRTISGKVVELAVRNVVHGQKVKNTDALANPEALEQFRDRPELMD